MRSLAHIERITNIYPIPGADRIELAQVLGWKCIVQKGEFKPEDLAIYVEIDSILPERPEFEFLRDRKFRIRTWKLSKFGVVSQGILFPLSILQEGIFKRGLVGTDVTERLGITKYEAPEPIVEVKPSRNWLLRKLMRYGWFRKLWLSKPKPSWPTGVPKTDEVRCIEESTYIDTDQGYLKIKDLYENIEDHKKPILAKTYNIETGTAEFKPIIAIIAQKQHKIWLELTTEDNKSIILTEDHLVYLPKLNCYREAKDLKPNDLLLVCNKN